MAVNKGPILLDGDLPEQENVLQRVLQLPVVSGTCECVQKTYASTKEAHPLVASVCNAYEKGVQSAGSLAAWGMEPVVRRLSTQFIAANELACRGLDHLEEKIPALQYPPEKIASELKGTISTRLRSARNSISVPIASTSDKVLGAALAGCELAWGVARDTAEYAASTRAGRLASGGADLALGSIEKVVELLLPPAKEESAPAPGRQRAQKPPKAKPSLVSRVGTLANTLSQHAMQTTARVLRQGHALAMWIPGVAPLSSLAQWGASAAMQVVSRRQSEVRVPWLHNLAAAQEEDHDNHTDSEGEETEEEEDMEATENTFREAAAPPSVQGLLGGVAHALQKALRSTVSVVTWAPATVLGTAGRMLHLLPPRPASSTKGRAMSLSDALKGVTDNVVDTVVHYVPYPPPQKKIMTYWSPSSPMSIEAHGWPWHEASPQPFFPPAALVQRSIKKANDLQLQVPYGRTQGSKNLGRHRLPYPRGLDHGDAQSGQNLGGVSLEPASQLSYTQPATLGEVKARALAGVRALGPKEGTLTRLPGPQLPRLSLMEPESEFRDIDNPPPEVERRGSGAPPTSPETAPRPGQPRGSQRSARGLSAPSCPGLEDKMEMSPSQRPGFPAVPREKPKRRVSDSFFRPSVMEPILGRAQYNQLRKKS
ncbi:Perilipin-1 [Tupaia chinensis]|uniref:Perilipin-1 n=1 Tax=Tupaia chinensis TaxID=246437 RepID=L9KJX5_TUPCH|nr:Perilipin-1 [Tupaia chinensis]